MTYNEIVQVIESLPAQMADVRAKRGLSIRAAAEEANLAHMTWYHIENGDVSPAADKVVAILQWLDRQPDYVLAEA